jgi:hypothetical protein
MSALILAAVVVELFTSQGCSSCPPADRLVSELVKQHGQVIPLAFHVDYWDNPSWRDPFSSHQWTERQLMYAQSFKLNGAYTPQMVVNGSRQFVGSNAAAMNAAVDDAARARTAGSVALDATRNGATINATIRADAPPNSDIVLVVFENGLSTAIRGGENSGRSAVDDAIVRKLWRVKAGNVSIPISPGWKNIGVVVFLQDRTTLAIGPASSVILSRADGEGSQVTKR